MANSFYDHTTFPVPNAAGTSKSMRDELDAIEQGFDKFPQLTSSVSGLVLKVNSGGTAIETSSALNAFTISSSDLTNCVLSNPTISAATINNLGATNISGTGTFNISASSGKLINVQIGSAGQTKNIFASAITTNSLTATGNTDLSIFNFNGSEMSADSTARIKLSGGYPFTDIDRTFVKTYHLEAVATSKMTYLMGQTAAGTGLAIHFNNNNIINMNSATTTLGAVNKGQLDTQINIVDNAKYEKSGGTVGGAFIVTGQADFNATANFGSLTTFSADIDLLNNNINNVASATSGLQAVNKNQMDHRVDTAVADLVSAAPGLLDTLGELADAIDNNEDFAGSMASVHATKLTIDGSNAMTGNLNVNNNLVINVSSATATHHAINKAQLDIEVASRQSADLTKLNLTGGSVGALSLTGDINLQSAHGVINAASVTAETTGTTLSTKEYVDRKSIAIQMVYSI